MNAQAPQIDFAGNDYLGLARDSRLAEAAHDAMQQQGISATSSRWGLGWTEFHEQLEVAMAEFMDVEACCLLSSAYLGGLIYFTALADQYDTVFCDDQCHTNLTLGMRAAGLEVRTYRHLDADDLTRRLEAWTGRRPIIASDSIFGISGELAPLRDLRDVARAYDAELLIDDAHGVFALGQKGRGTTELCGLTTDDATILGSMSKALGTAGGFLAGRMELVERFRRSDPSTSATPLAIPIVAASLESLRIVQEEPQLRQQLDSNAAQMREMLKSKNIPFASEQTPIIAMAMPNAGEAEQLSRHFLTHGLRIPHFAYPTNPSDNLLRTVARSCYTEEDLQRFADAIGTFGV